MTYEFGLSTEKHNRLDARLAAIREEHDATLNIPHIRPTPQEHEDDLTFVDAAIQGFSNLWNTLGRLFSSSELNPRRNPYNEGEIEMRIVYDEEGTEWIKVINTNHMDELILMTRGGVAVEPSSINVQQQTSSTSHQTLQLPHSPPHRKRTFQRNMSDGYLSSLRADARHEVDLLMEQAADEVTADLHLPIPPFTQVC